MLRRVRDVIIRVALDEGRERVFGGYRRASFRAGLCLDVVDILEVVVRRSGTDIIVHQLLLGHTELGRHAVIEHGHGKDVFPVLVESVRLSSHVVRKGVSLIELCPHREFVRQVVGDIINGVVRAWSRQARVHDQRFFGPFRLDEGSQGD